MTSAGVPMICLVCRGFIEPTTSLNIFSTSLPRSGELLASLVLGTISPSLTDLQSSYLCSQCSILFQMLEEAQCRVTTIQNEILKTYNSSTIAQTPKDGLYTQETLETSAIDSNSYQVPQSHNFVAHENETDQPNSTNYLIRENDIESRGNSHLSEIPNSHQIDGLSSQIVNNESLKGDARVEQLSIVQDYKAGRKLKKPKKSGTTNPKYSCSICDKQCKTSTELKAHEGSHSSERPYMCEKCGQAYKHKHALKVHIGMHNGINPFKCNFCDKCFTQKGALMRHLPMHTGEMPYQCDLCDRRFVHHTSYNMHMLSHTGKKTHRCDICDVLLLSASHLKRHMRGHTGEKKFSCALCGKRFAERYNLCAHQKIHETSDLVPTSSEQILYRSSQCSEIFGEQEPAPNHVQQDHHRPLTQNNDQNAINSNWLEINDQNNKILPQANYRDFDVIIRNTYQESFNMGSI